MSQSSVCMSCAGSGEMPTDYGPTDCPDCGGGGYLPSRATLSEWRANDVARSVSEDKAIDPQAVSWLLAELRTARAALRDIVALAHDIRDDEQIALRIRMVAGNALGLYQSVAPDELERRPS